MKKHVLKNLTTGKYVIRTMKQILEEINRDRSDQWINYDESDFTEGLWDFTDYEYIGEVE